MSLLIRTSKNVHARAEQRLTYLFITHLKEPSVRERVTKGKSSGGDFPRYVLPTSVNSGWGLPELEVKAISLPIAVFEGFLLVLMLSVFLV